jgi:small subunit ribosomal protein S16
MLRIRLSRTGKKRQPSYRVVVADVGSKRDGRVVERIGHYNPLSDEVGHKINENRALYWLSVGAQPSNAVQRLLEKQGTYERLGRLRRGESLESLVAEYEGSPATLAAVATKTAARVAPLQAVIEEATVDEAVVAAAEAIVAVEEEE